MNEKNSDDRIRRLCWSYEDRILRLRGALEELARGQLGPLSYASFARQAADNDRKIAERDASED